MRRYDALFPIRGRAAANLWPCAFWPFDPEPAVAIGRQDGGQTTLLVQSVRDPATPIDGALTMRTTLGARARFVTVENGAHSVVFNGVDSCADAKVGELLAAGTVPNDSYC